MDRNDAILATICIGLCCGVGLMAISLVNGAGNAAEWAGAIGTVGAILVAILMPRWERERREHRERVIAAMRVAARLRSWLTTSAGAITDVLSFYSQGDERQVVFPILTIPDLNLDMDEIANLDIRHAKILYSIMEQHVRARQAVSDIAEAADFFSAMDEYFNQAARLFRRVRKQYRKLARELGLHPSTCQRWELDNVNDAAKRGSVRGWKNI